MRVVRCTSRLALTALFLSCVSLVGAYGSDDALEERIALVEPSEPSPVIAPEKCSDEPDCTACARRNEEFIVEYAQSRLDCRTLPGLLGFGWDGEGIHALFSSEKVAGEKWNERVIETANEYLQGKLGMDCPFVQVSAGHGAAQAETAGSAVIDYEDDGPFVTPGDSILQYEEMPGTFGGILVDENQCRYMLSSHHVMPNVGDTVWKNARDERWLGTVKASVGPTCDEPDESPGGKRSRQACSAVVDAAIALTDSTLAAATPLSIDPERLGTEICGYKKDDSETACWLRPGADVFRLGGTLKQTTLKYTRASVCVRHEGRRVRFNNQFVLATVSREKVNSRKNDVCPAGSSGSLILGQRNRCRCPGGESGSSACCRGENCSEGCVPKLHPAALLLAQVSNPGGPDFCIANPIGTVIEQLESASDARSLKFVFKDPTDSPSSCRQDPTAPIRKAWKGWADINGATELGVSSRPLVPAETEAKNEPYLRLGIDADYRARWPLRSTIRQGEKRFLELDIGLSLDGFWQDESDYEPLSKIIRASIEGDALGSRSGRFPERLTLGVLLEREDLGLDASRDFLRLLRATPAMRLTWKAVGECELASSVVYLQLENVDDLLNRHDPVFDRSGKTETFGVNYSHISGLKRRAVSNCERSGLFRDIASYRRPSLRTGVELWRSQPHGSEFAAQAKSVYVGSILPFKQRIRPLLMEFDLRRTSADYESLSAIASGQRRDDLMHSAELALVYSLLGSNTTEGESLRHAELRFGVRGERRVSTISQFDYDRVDVFMGLKLRIAPRGPTRDDTITRGRTRIDNKDTSDLLKPKTQDELMNQSLP